MSDDLSRSIASAVSQAVQRAVDEGISRLPSQGVSSTSSSSTSSTASVSTSRSNSNSQEVRTCAGRQTVIVFVWNMVCYVKLNIWPFSFFLFYCSVCCWFLWFACCSSSSIKISVWDRNPAPFTLLYVFVNSCQVMALQRLETETLRLAIKIYITLFLRKLSLAVLNCVLHNCILQRFYKK